ncbi:2-dehydro-3-deoxygalactonokinase [Janthinobacterium sp. HLX7-2]|uniref:2-dehydro-3-deoxygalactonokinase n=1 Tax=Janthinobacterium sp. HLX7-2 TaxID=1259331 RepID=UPI003F1FD4DA
MNQMQCQTQLIALDWGTSSLRAYRLGVDGQVLELRSLPWGIMRLPDVAPAKESGADGADGADDKTGFELAFEQACGDWLRAAPDAPVIAAGMVGSREGWRETPYLSIPITLGQIGSTLNTVRTRTGKIVHIVPGLIQNSALPNVMRGEETQVIGALSMFDTDQDSSRTELDEVLIGLPGTHSKWVGIRRQDSDMQSHITHFSTFMTGELYALLCAHSILGRGMQAGDSGSDDHFAFDRGVLVAQTPAGHAGVLSTIFSTRTLGLTGVLDGAGQREYLSGLLIGHEIAALKALQLGQGQQFPRVILIGDAALCERYMRALRAYGIEQIEVAAQATERGLWQLALAAGLLTRVADMNAE